MNNTISKPKVISSLFWKLMERVGKQGIQLIVQIILARLLTPSDFGTIAIVLVFVNIAQIFVQSGLNTALVQKKDSDNLDFSTVFYSSLFISLILYLVVFVASPYISIFYKDADLTNVLRVIALMLFPGALNSVQSAYISKGMHFKKLFYCSFGAVIVSGVVSIAAAYLGAGVWALVIQNLLYQTTMSAIMWFTVKWRPQWLFSFERLKGLFSFGGKLLISSLIDTIFTDLRTLVIGRIYDPSTLGYYNKGQQFPGGLIATLDGSIQVVMLPTYSAIQDDMDGLKRGVRRSIKTSSFVIFPMMIGLAAVSEPLIKILLGAKWLPAVIFMQIFCISYMVRPLTNANLQAINGMGRSDIYLKLEIIKKIISVVILVISIPFGVYAIAIGQGISLFIAVFVNAYPNKNLLNYSIKEQISDIMPALSISIFMGLIVYLFGLINLPTWLLLICQILLGCVIYVGMSKLFKIESMIYIKKTITEMIHAKKAKK